jgi:hypothetical protein
VCLFIFKLSSNYLNFFLGVYGPNVTLRRALVKGQHGVAADNQQKVKDMLTGLVPMTEHEVDMATKKKPVSDLYEGMGGLVALERALSLKGNCILYPSKKTEERREGGEWALSVVEQGFHLGKPFWGSNQNSSHQNSSSRYTV